MYVNPHPDSIFVSRKPSVCLYIAIYLSAELEPPHHVRHCYPMTHSGTAVANSRTEILRFKTLYTRVMKALYRTKTLSGIRDSRHPRLGCNLTVIPVFTLNSKDLVPTGYRPIRLTLKLRLAAGPLFLPRTSAPVCSPPLCIV